MFTNKTVLIDNARFHKSTDTLSHLASNKISHLYLPPYSSELNPIKGVFSGLKIEYYNVRLRPSSLDGVVSAVEWVINDMNLDLVFSAFYCQMRKYLDLAFFGHRF
ncbi:hypothetical protein CDIK_4165 [Cucumispora dikerogammari]|nr:hypothetical protein CDIK_4165 [Cucumispora dikerogammari]